METDKRIPKHWVDGFKRFTGVEPTYEEYLKHPTMFDGHLSFYDKHPVLSWIIMILFVAYAIWGSIVVFNA